MGEQCALKPGHIVNEQYNGSGEVHVMARRRRFTPQFKTQVTLEVISSVKRAAEACRECNLKPSVVSEWITTLMTNAANGFDD